jgi:pimeloyl-ACP methyl ester carboxylesterase
MNMNQLVDVGETKLYCEVHGTGPSLVLVPGASGDGGYMQPLADALANEFTVVTYDRRGSSRSPRPEAWSQTSIEEQARDLAGLIRVLNLAPTVVLGNSYGAVIALCAVMEHKRFFRGALLHDPTLMSVLEHPEEPQAILRPIIEEAMAKGGPRAAMEAFVEFAFGERARALPDAVIDRMLGNAEILFGIEFGNLESWRPDEESLRAVRIPVCPLVGKESPPFAGEAAAWVAARVGNEVIQVPGGHVGFIDNAHEFAEVTRPLIRSMT